MTKEQWWDKYFILTDSIHMFNNSSIRLSTKYVLNQQTEDDIFNFRVSLLQVIFGISDLCGLDNEYTYSEVLDTMTEKYDIDFGLTLNFVAQGILEESGVKAITSEILTLSKIATTLTYIEFDNRIDLAQLLGTHTLQEKIVNHIRGVHEGSKVGRIVRTAIQNQFTEMPRQRVRYLTSILTDNINVNMLVALYSGVDYNVLNNITSIQSIYEAYNKKNDADIEFLANFFTSHKTDNPVRLNQIILEVRNNLLSMVVQESNIMLENVVYLNTTMETIFRKLGTSTYVTKYVLDRALRVKDFITTDFTDSPKDVLDEVPHLNEFIRKNIAHKDSEEFRQKRGHHEYIN